MKMKNAKRILAVFLTLLMILPSAALVGCSKRYLSNEDMPTANSQSNNAFDAELTPVEVEEDEITSDAEKEEAESAKETVAAENNNQSNLSDALAGGVAADPDPTISLSELSQYKIIYYNSAYAKLCAEKVQTAIKDATGIELALGVDAETAVSTKEILVGKTNRDESIAVRSDYSRHNVYYDIKVVGTKLVIMAEGYKTLEYVTKEFEQYMAKSQPFVGSVISGDISAAIDIVGTSMFNRASGTSLRVFHWNVGAPLLALTPGILNVTDIPSNTHRGEVVADIILQLDPDIITTNEIYYGHASGKFYDAFITEISEFYNILDNDYYASASSSVCSSSSGYETGYPTKYPNPVVGAYKSGEISIPENILYKKSLGLTVTYSGWRYLDEDTGTVTTNNPSGAVYFHGYHTAVFKTSAGKSFIISVGHYGSAKTDNKFAADHYTAISYAANKAGVTLSSTPTIVTGDMFTWNATNCNAGYNYWSSTKGFNDSQLKAKTNANGNTTHGTFHTAGVRKPGVSEDFVWYKNFTSALCFKVLVSMEIDDCSDHYPVMSDLKF